MFRAALSLVVSAVFILAPTLAPASDSPVLARIAKQGELRVGMSASQPPLNMKSKTGEIIGLEADLATVLAAAMGVELKIVEKPFPELLGALEKKQVDMVMSGMTITLERNMRAAFVGPYMISGKSILTSSQALAGADEAEDINAESLRLAALENSTSQKFVEMAAPKAKLVVIQDYDEGVRMVLAGEVEALVADYPICLLSVLRNPGKGLVAIAPLSLEPIGIALPAGDPLLVNLVQNYLGAMSASGLLDRLKERWLQDPSWLEQLP